MTAHKKILAVAMTAAILPAGTAEAVYQDADGIGQALIYPYYTTRSADGNPFNTYISVANTTPDAKAVRVRIREGLAGKVALDFNLYLSPNDMWTAALVPNGLGGALALSHDESCAFPGGTLLRDRTRRFELTNVGYVGDGLGDGLDRTREGYVEVLEMASLTGDAAAAVSHVNGMPDDCSFVQAGPNTADQLPPSGGLMGTLTLINVANGQDFTVNAIALADLAAAAMYRDSPDPYPDFDAAEVRPESRVFLNGLLYGLRWTGGRDAVSSVLMSTQVLNEFVRDSGTSSQADWVVTLPTLRLYATGEAPFRIRPDSWNLNLDVFDREERAFTTGDCFFGGAGCFRSFFSFYAASVVPIDEGSWEPNEAPPTGVLGSHNVLSIIEPSSPLLQSGWARLSLNPLFDWSMESEPGSTSYDPATGAIRSGRFQVGGLPVTGLMVRTFKNGTLHCGSAACQGNYGGSFSHRYVRSITELP